MASLQTRALECRFDGIESRLDVLEGASTVSNALPTAVESRWNCILQRISLIEQHLGRTSNSSPASPGRPAVVSGASTPASHAVHQGLPGIPEGESEVYRAMHSELSRRGITRFQLARVGAGYYDLPLEQRARAVGAASEAQMCKTMVMENTRAPADVVDCADPRLSKYYMILVQYVAAINADKLRGFISKLSGGVRQLPRSKINMRMVAEQTAHELTGFGHNAVTPVGSRTRIPIIVSHRIAELTEPFFLGAGETDLKVGMLSCDFIRAFEDVPVFVVDCTVD